MAKQIFICALLFNIILCSASPQKQQSIEQKNVEWLNFRMPKVNDSSLPNALLIGDFVTEQYAGEVERQLEGKVNVMCLSTNRPMLGNDIVLNEILMLVHQYKFDIMHFYNDINDCSYSVDEFKKEFSKLFEAIKQNAPHASGFYREAFKIYKGMFERIFMMGVSPVTLDDLTSGFNIGWSISTDPDFNMMLGFSETEVREMLQYYKEAGALEEDVEAMITEIKPWYDNYCFAPDSLETDPKIFNCDMVLYYLNNYLKRGKAPEQMIDPNTRTDYNKMKRLIQLDRLDGNRKGVIQDIAEKGFIITNLVTSFPAEQIARKEIFPSLLFYYGMLTITGTRGSRLILSIPNNNVRKQYYEYMLEEYQASRHLDLNDLLNAFDSMKSKNIFPLIELIERKTLVAL